MEISKPTSTFGKKRKIAKWTTITNRYGEKVVKILKEIDAMLENNKADHLFRTTKNFLYFAKLLCSEEKIRVVVPICYFNLQSKDSITSLKFQRILNSLQKLKNIFEKYNVPHEVIIDVSLLEAYISSNPFKTIRRLLQFKQELQSLEEVVKIHFTKFGLSSFLISAIKMKISPYYWTKTNRGKIQWIQIQKLYSRSIIFYPKKKGSSFLSKHSTNPIMSY